MEKPLPPSEYYSLDKALKSLEQVNPWIEQAMQRAMEYRDTLQHSFESTIAATQSRLSQIRSTSSAHFQQTLVNVSLSLYPFLSEKLWLGFRRRLILIQMQGYVEDLKADYATYEEKFFANVKGFRNSLFHSMGCVWFWIWF